MILLFDYAGPTIVALAVFLIFYFMRPVFITDSNRIFLILVVTEIIGFISNMLSAYADNNGTDYYKSLLIIINNIYYSIYILRYFLFCLYFASLLKIKKRKNILFTLVSIIFTVVILLIIINSWTGYIYQISPTGEYNIGDYVILIYISNLATIVLNIYYLAISIKKLNHKDRITIAISIFILLSCCFIDYFYIEYVISDIFFLLVMSILYLTFENPEIYYDKKTGLLNVQAFKDSVSNDLFRHKNYSTYGFAIKNYNELKEVYGPKQIDIVLREISNYLETNYSKLNAFYLQNGKFAVIEQNTTSCQNIRYKIENRFNEPWLVKNDTNIKLNVTFVYLDRTLDFSSYDQIMACVEQAVFELKQFSTHSITIDDRIYQKVLRKKKILQILNKSLEEDSLKVFLQPIVDANSKKIIAAEALVRLYDKDLGIISPIEFISMAEENGYIEKLGEQVLNKVCLFWHREDLENYGIQWINVNLSPIQCLNSKLINKVNKITQDNNIETKYIHLEITEESLIDKQILKGQINKLIESGYKISLDDFGSGFSNLYSIKAFPFSNIKLDMSLVTEHCKSPDNMLPGIVKIFRDRGLSVTAEGVETAEMAEQLREMGCNYLQGYYFSKPVPQEDFLKLIKD